MKGFKKNFLKSRSNVVKEKSDAPRLGRARLNDKKKPAVILAIVLVTLGLILWVLMLGKKAEETVEVAIFSKNIYKNEVITKESLEPYAMLRGEYEKYVVTTEAGQKVRRILLWSEVDKVINSFAAYPLMKHTYADYRSFIKSRLDNSDSIMYAFPGKNAVPLKVGIEELQAFKTFLKPGDKINIVAIYKERLPMMKLDGYGGQKMEDTEVLRTEKVFNNIMVADLLNASGSSVLDMYSYYNDLSAWNQANMDNDPNFQKATQPNQLILALTPEEEERYYLFSSKDSVVFKMSLPQRTE